MTGLYLKYFVLKPKSSGPFDYEAHASRRALATYATHIKNHNPQLAADIERWLNVEMENALALDRLYLDLDNETG